MQNQQQTTIHNISLKMIFQTRILIILLCGSCLFLATSAGANTNAEGLVINEILASNASQQLDTDFYNFSDWIELYNGTASPIDLNGYYLSDDVADPTKWEFQGSVVIGAYDYLLVWADGEDTGLHTNFGLKHEGETVYLYDTEQNLVDSLEFTEQVPDVSYGRETDGSATYVYYSSPTPAQTNNGSLGLAAPITAFEPQFSQNGGFYDGAQQISLTLPPDTPATIYYTLDGSIPDTDSLVYSGSITLHETTVVRARALGPNLLPSPIVSQTYLIDEETTLPVISISTNAEYFFDDTIGIYVEGTNGTDGHCASGNRNWNQEWERPVNVQFFEDDRSEGFNMNGGVEITGNCSRRFTIKPLKISFRDKYGDKDLDYQVFKNSPIDEWGYFFLRNSGNDWRYTYFREGFMQELIRGYMDVDSRNYRPAVVFLNGNYFGIHNIREKLDTEYLAAHHGVDPNNVDLLKTKLGTIEGSTSNYSDMLDYLRDHDMNDPQHYAHIQDWVDIDEFIDYQIAQIYYANTDWPGNNIKYWRPRTDDGRWRWLLYDTDYGFGSGLWDQEISTPTHNTLEMATASDGIGWPNPPWSTEVLRELLEGDAFRHEFIQRFAAHISITFNPVRTVEMIDFFEERLEDEMPRHIDLVDAPNSMSRWHDEVDVMREFANLRPEIMFEHIEHKFLISDTHKLTMQVEPAGAGNILVQGVPLNMDELTGSFYPDLPIRMEAVSNPSYRFLRWEGISTDTTSTTTFSIQGDASITAVFAPFDAPQLVINEIHYNPAPAPLQGEDADFEFVEIYNNDTVTIDLTGMRLTEAVEFTFPSASIDPGEYIVIANQAAAYEGQGYQVFEWGDPLDSKMLSNSGELLKLENGAGNLIDIVAYSDDPLLSWAVLPDGDGHSLELIAPSLENGGEAAEPAAPQNWEASTFVGGTPGRANDEVDTAEEHPVLINEIYYEPLIVDDDNNALEFIELYNRGEEAVDLSGYELAGAISYIFSAGTMIEPGEFILIANDSSYYTGAGYPFRAFTWDSGRLSNSGELLLLQDGEGNWIDIVNYKTDQSSGWPAMTPTFSLEVIPASAANHYGHTWESSIMIGGTPGRANHDDYPTISIEDTEVWEGDEATKIVFLKTALSYAVPFNVSVNYAPAADTALGGEDFIDTTGLLTFNSGTLEQFVPVTLIGDENFEPSKSLFMQLSDPVNGQLLDDQALLTIKNDDAPRLTLSDSQIVISEGTGITTTVKITVSLEAAMSLPMSFSYMVVPDSATAAADFEVVEDTVIMSAEKLEHVINLNIVGDAVDELDEELFYLKFTDIQNMMLLEESISITIMDDDEPTAVLSAADISLPEGDIGTHMAVFTVSLSAATEVTATVYYETADDTAVAGADYQPASGTLIFAPGQTTQTIQVPLLSDELLEEDEQFVILLSQPAHLLLEKTELVVTILNDDEDAPPPHYIALMPVIVRP